jgi:hypothetical protein
MAKPIEATPVLKGDDAFEFVSEMENITVIIERNNDGSYTAVPQHKHKIGFIFANYYRSKPASAQSLCHGEKSHVIENSSTYPGGNHKVLRRVA